MNALIWDDIYSWTDNEIVAEGSAHSKACAEYLLKITTSIGDDESKILISDESIMRYCSLCEHFFSLIKSYSDTKNNSILLNCWILLGSLAETTMQMFIAFYARDYRSAKWMQWASFNQADLMKEIDTVLNNLTNTDIINNDQRKSLREAIKDEIKKHTKEHPIEKVMLDELIQFYNDQKIFDDDEIKQIRKIQEYRNGIHSFQKRKIGTWDELIEGAKFLCYLQEWIMNRLPDEIEY